MATIDPADHIGLVFSIVNKHVRLRHGETIEETEEFSDAIQGLYQAIDRYDSSRGKFSTCAYQYIRGHILNGRRDRKRRGRHEIHSINSYVKKVAMMPIDPLRESRQQEAGMDVEALLAKFPPEMHKNKMALIGWYLEGKSLEDLSVELGGCRERARQRRNEALEYLQQASLCS